MPSRAHAPRVRWRSIRRPLLLLALPSAVLVVSLLDGAGESSASAAPVSLLAGAVVFTRSRDELSDLYVVRLNGPRTRLLVRNGKDAAASPDGRQIAFERNGAIWVMSRDGSRQQVVTKPLPRTTPKGTYPAVIDGSPAWSPDGRAIYFDRFVLANGTTSLYRVSRQGKAIRRLTYPRPTDHGHCHVDPAPSPSGTVIAFVEAEDCEHGSDVFVAAVTATGRPARLPFTFPGRMITVGGVRFHEGPTVFDPAWAHDGQRMAYAVMDINGDYPGPDGVHVSTADGTRPRPVSRGLDESPTWLGDGGWIAFARTVVTPSEHQGDIWLARADGTGLRRVTSGASDDRDPAWLPRAR